MQTTEDPPWLYRLRTDTIQIPSEVELLALAATKCAKEHRHFALYLTQKVTGIQCYSYGICSLLNTESGTNWDSDSKPDGYIVLCRTCSHCTGSDSDPSQDSDSQSLLYPFLGWMSVPVLGSKSVSGNTLPLKQKFT